MTYLVIYTVDNKGSENAWQVDSYETEPDRSVKLFRSGQHIITLGPDDYCNGFVVETALVPMIGDEYEFEVEGDFDIANLADFSMAVH
jgi:hypothetical protein